MSLYDTSEQNASKEQALLALARNRKNRVNHTSSFVVETLVLLIFLAISFTVISSSFAKAHSIGEEANETTVAIILATTGASNGAEAFESDPTGSSDTLTYYMAEGSSFDSVDSLRSGAYAVHRTIEAEQRTGGTLYYATIEVSHNGDSVYKLTSRKYVSDGRG